MVLINLKLPQGDQAADGFLLEASCSTRKIYGPHVVVMIFRGILTPPVYALAATDDLISSLVEVHNLRLRSRIIAESVRALAAYGPTKSEEEEVSQGLLLSSYALPRIFPDRCSPCDDAGQRRIVREG